MEKGKKGLILVLMGVPGSGKSTLAKLMVQHYSSEPCSTDVFHVCYDELLNDRADWDSIGYNWKSGRNLVIQACKLLIDECVGEKRETSPDSRSTDDEPIIRTMFQHLCGQKRQPENQKERFMLIIDDNMYYRSMRVPYYQLAKQFRLAFGQIMIQPSTMKTALDRNSERPSAERIPNEIIERMNARLEPPVLTSSWELNSLTIPVADNSSPALPPQLDEFVHGSWDKMIMAENNDVQDRLLEIQREKDRLLTKENKIHQIDLILRKRISETMKSDSLFQTSDGELRKHYGRAMSAVKVELLQGFKSGSLICDGDPDDQQHYLLQILHEAIQNL